MLDQHRIGNPRARDFPSKIFLAKEISRHLTLMFSSDVFLGLALPTKSSNPALHDSSSVVPRLDLTDRNEEPRSSRGHRAAGGLRVL